MYKILKESEIGAAADLIKGGLNMASEAMGMILQSPISIKQIDYDVQATQDPPVFSSKTDSKVHVLRTEIKGDLQGVCYLILSEDEAGRIMKACLPADILANESSKNQMMKDGFLTELDNMVAAAVITQFADHSGLTLFGHVPSLTILTAEEVNQHIHDESANFPSILHFKAIFHGNELGISPDFVWLVQDEFVSKIKPIA